MDSGWNASIPTSRAERKMSQSEAVSPPVGIARLLDGKNGGLRLHLFGPFCALRGWNFVPIFPVPRGEDGKCVIRRGST